MSKNTEKIKAQFTLGALNLMLTPKSATALKNSLNAVRENSGVQVELEMRDAASLLEIKLSHNEDDYLYKSNSGKEWVLWLSTESLEYIEGNVEQYLKNGTLFPAEQCECLRVTRQMTNFNKPKRTPLCFTGDPL